MNSYHFTLYTSADGYIESNISSFLSSALIRNTVAHPNFRPANTMLLPLYDLYTPPEHPYIRASSAYSAVVQLYARSGQLDCAYTRFLRFGDMSPRCLAGCDDLETMHHIFVLCPSFDHLRNDAANTVHMETSKMLHNADVPLSICIPWLHLVRKIFMDREHWPRHISQYYLGILPPLPPALTTKASPFQSKRLQTRLLHSWHSTAIRLAGRIWGNYQKSARMTRRGGLASKSQRPSIKPIAVPSFLADIIPQL
ncbi:hypothetical protein EDD18DRAFT_1174155 [Armillaria luteobubalina]|uniref:Uncharacterized protein n=1 Tax=Armillaria luteobubalina TaxID=153913 RepID=A0AA39Q256_9AGAR|nr:hypothetical protein EDD18DRAFT_1174155 [Armillaria luteobubalina]